MKPLKAYTLAIAGLKNRISRFEDLMQMAQSERNEFVVSMSKKAISELEEAIKFFEAEIKEIQENHTYVYDFQK